MANIEFEIVQSIACLAEEKNGWVKELNFISWNKREAKYDIRAWSKDHSKMGKGVTLDREELINLKSILDELFE